MTQNCNRAYCGLSLTGPENARTLSLLCLPHNVNVSALLHRYVCSFWQTEIIAVREKVKQENKPWAHGVKRFQPRTPSTCKSFDLFNRRYVKQSQKNRPFLPRFTCPVLRKTIRKLLERRGHGFFCERNP